ncbi:hypothetical protein [Frondihabitans australicus]|uniref:DUF1877 family protein n=1 Tax=Frondihabitans australicus TaxID=386892 RepID=A0A495IGY0_9MICO|nr:hypothetical protein [Frondihabitans australicus]RKR74940.1 hypothetical protein C8E83_2074 [Frondihabitans australicus]
MIGNGLAGIDQADVHAAGFDEVHRDYVMEHLSKLQAFLTACKTSGAGILYIMG